MNMKYWIIAGVVFALLLVPAYNERHVYLNAFFTQPRICYGIWYTGGAPFSHCSSETIDCSTTASGGTVCTHTDITDVIAFGGVSLMVGCLMLLTSMTISYPISKRLGWI